MDFPELFSPTEIRGIPFKNRLFFGPHGTGMSEGGLLGARQIAYYEARIRNDIGLIFTEAHHVEPLEGIVYPTCSAATDACIPALAEMAALCETHDVRFFGQLFHEGRSALSLRDGRREVTVAPSAIPDERHHTVPRAMTVPMIEELVGHFATAAERMVRAGVDGIEILVGMGYLHAQFLSPHVNQRTDDYGGSPEGRRRFLEETLIAIRNAIGDRPALGFRIVPQDDDPDGLDLEESVAQCVAIADAGVCDFINIAVGNVSTLAGVPSIVPSMYTPAGACLPPARAVRSALIERGIDNVKVLAAGRINQPQEAERALAEGDVDMVGAVRAFIADHEFATKAKQGRADEIRACIACNQACIGHRATGHAISCIQHPATSRERTYGNVDTAPKQKSVVVVGGGPGGMKAAAVAAERGHAVTLIEKAPRLGGQVLLAQKLPGRAEFGGVITNLLSEIDRYGVTVETGVAATTELVHQHRPDVVIIATGATPFVPNPEWFEGAHVVTAWEVLRGEATVGKNVVVADWRCDWIGPGVAELLRVDQRCDVRLAVNGETVGYTVQNYLKYQLAGRLHAAGVEVIPYMRLIGADQDTVYLQHVVNAQPVLLEGVDTLVLASGHRGGLGLHDALVGEVPELYAIGDCLSPRTVEEAISEGLETAFLL